MTDLRGYEGLYQVSKDGRVFSIRHQCFLKDYSNGTGYRKVNLYDRSGKQHKVYVHRAVAEAFLPNPTGMKEVNHIDCYKTNNAVWNLEWCTRHGNLIHSYRKGKKRTGEGHGMHKLTCEQVRAIREEYVYGSKEHGTMALAKKYGVHQSTVAAITSGRHWKGVI
jgi:hypothetical protein